MGIKRIGSCGVLRRQQPHLAQARDRALPGAFIEIDDRVGEPRDRRLAAQCGEASAARRSVEQADQAHDGMGHRLAGEPLCLVGLHDPPGVIVAWVFGIVEQFADMIAPAYVAALRLLEEAREQAERQRMAAERPGRRPQFRVRSPHAVVAQKRRAGFV